MSFLTGAITRAARASVAARTPFLTQAQTGAARANGEGKQRRQHRILYPDAISARAYSSGHEEESYEVGHAAFPRLKSETSILTGVYAYRPSLRDMRMLHTQ
jgi:hypothetical protein